MKNRYENIEEKVEPNDIDLTSFDTRSELNSDIWDGDVLNKRVRRNLLVIARDFVDNLNIEDFEIEDIILTGSLANYNWDEQYSDIDLHIVVDFSEICKDTDMVKDYFDELRKNWNKNHDNVSIYGYPVELYVQDVDEIHKSSGIYSVLHNEWVKKPSLKSMKNNSLDKNDVKDKVADFENRIDDMESDFSACSTMDELEELYNKADELFDEIKKTRQSGMNQRNPEMSEGNIIFKSLRRFGYIEKLLTIRTNCYDAMVSIE